MRITSPNDLPNLVSARRTALHLTQADVARRAGLTRQWISGFENGHGADLTLVWRLLAALDLTVTVTPRAATDIRTQVVASVPPAARSVTDLDAHLARLSDRALNPFVVDGPL